MKDFLFRKAQLSDVPILVEIYMKKLLKDFSWDITMQKMFQERYKESIPRLMKKETLVVYLAYQQETLVGMAEIYIWGKEIAEEEATLSSIYVLPELRENNMIKQLFFMLLQEAKKRNCTVIKTLANGNREQLYQLGFQDTSDEEGNGLSNEMELKISLKNFKNML